MRFKDFFFSQNCFDEFVVYVNYERSLFPASIRENMVQIYIRMKGDF